MKPIPASKLSPQPVVLAMLIAFAMCPSSARANYLEDMGYFRLERYLPVGTMPIGAGVPVMLIEANEIGTPSYAPVAGITDQEVAGAGVFSGKTFTIRSADTVASSHASTVGQFFFGNNTNPSLGSASMAPGVSDIFCYAAGNNPPNAASNGVIRSNAWIGTSSDNEAAAAFLRSIDFEMNATGVLHVSGLNNGSNTTIPKLLGPAYNGIAAGLSNGNHSRGTTPDLEPDLPDEGRIKPELVAPNSLTSWTTGMISSAATLVYSAASGAAQNGLVIKAALLAGASRSESEFPVSANWETLAVDKPLHPYLGAGEVDVYRSHAIVTSSQQAPSDPPVKICGWDIRTKGVDTAAYNLVVPQGQALEVAACLTWNSRVILGVRQPLADMSLTLRNDAMTILAQSDSPVDNVELVVEGLLPAGNYILEVDGPSNTEYALAWLIDGRIDVQLTLAVSGLDVEITMDNLIPGKAFRLQRFGTDGRWNTISTFTPVAATAMFTDAGAAPTSGKQLLYRVICDEL